MISSSKKNCVCFSIQTNCGFGNAVYVQGDAKEIQEPLRLNVQNDENWSLEVVIDPNQNLSRDMVHFRYFIAAFEDPTLNIQQLDDENLQNSFSMRGLKDQFVTEDLRSKESLREGRTEQRKDLEVKDKSIEPTDQRLEAQEKPLDSKEILDRQYKGQREGMGAIRVHKEMVSDTKNQDEQDRKGSRTENQVQDDQQVSHGKAGVITDRIQKKV